MKVLSVNLLSRRCLAATTSTVLAGTLLAFAPAQAADDVTINLIGINDFHGRIDAATVQWAGTVEQLEADAPAESSLLISAGDNVSASLFASAVQDDNPTLDVLNAIGLDVSATGNHEFDKGYDDLVNRISERADFPILGANVTKADGSAALDASATFEVHGVRVAVVGAVTQETPALVSPAGIEGLSFGDPVDGINAEVKRLNALPDDERPEVIVASFHEGAPDGTMTFPEAVQSSTVFRHLVEDTSADVDAIFMGHTHQKYAYDAPVPGDTDRTRPVVQTGNYGENVGQIKLHVDLDTGDVSSYSSRNLARVTTSDADLIQSYPDLAAVKKIRDDAVEYATEVGQVEKGRITADITTAFADGARDDRASESSLGNLVADALLETVAAEPAGADLALVNPGGLRADLLYAAQDGTPGDAEGVTTYAELNSVLPFANNLVSVRLSGASLKKIFEQQWQRDGTGQIPSRPYLQLGTSQNVTYTFDPAREEGDRITSLRIDGAEIDPTAQYKVATFSFLAAGGDNFRGFTEGVTTDTGLVDRDGWIAYFEGNSPITPSFARHALQVEGLEATYAAGDQVAFTLPDLDLTSLGTPAATSVSATLVQGGQETPLGEYDVTDGAATVQATLPNGTSGSAAIRVDAAPSGTSVLLPAIQIEQSAAEADVDAVTLPFIPQGSWTLVIARVTGADGQPTGTVRVQAGDDTLGTAKVDRRAYVIVPVDARRLDPGRQVLTVRYTGDDTYGEASTDVSTTVLKRRR